MEKSIFHSILPLYESHWPLRMAYFNKYVIAHFKDFAACCRYVGGMANQGYRSILFVDEQNAPVALISHPPNVSATSCKVFKVRNHILVEISHTQRPVAFV